MVDAPLTVASTILLNWPCCGLANLGSMMRLTLNTTSSGVSLLPS
jgi:hypothetical protein